MNKKLTNFIDGVFAFLLVVCPLHCLASSFGLEVNIAILSLFTAMFVIVFGILIKTREKPSEYALGLGIITVIFILTVLLFKELLLAELDYAVNTITSVYSKYINSVTSVDFSSRIVNSATSLFVAVSAVLSGLLTTFIMRMRFIFPAATISIMAIVPCFILVNTLPKLLPLLVLFATLFTLFVTSQLHRINNVHSGVVGLAVAVLTAVLVLGVLYFVPQEGYERSDWQDELLNQIKELSILNEEGNGDDVLMSVEKEVDLSEEGPQKKKSQKVMTIKTQYSGMLYLKGVAYADYYNNTWSILDESKVGSYPQNYNSFNMTDTVYSNDIVLDISTVNKESILYTPYFLDDLNVYGNYMYDVLVENTTGTKDYTMYYSPFTVDDPLNYMDEFDSRLYSRRADIERFVIRNNPDNANYRSFVYKNYLALPSDVEEEMQALIEDEGLANLTQKGKIAAVRSYIKNSAIYSLNTDKVPKGKDIALWFLKESDTGYCVHFATSATVMLRAMGIPARYVTGYAKRITAGSMQIITTDNAHAWVEYFDADIGWVPLEVTPSDLTSQQAVETPTNVAPTQVPTEPPTQSTKPQATEPTTKPEATQGNTQSEDKNSLNVVTVVTVIGVVMLLTVVVLSVRRLALLALRKRRFYAGTRNRRARYVYRYLLKVEKYAKMPISSEVEAIAQKSRFSNSNISVDELDTILQFAQSKKELLATDDSRFKKIYYKFILALA